MVGASVYGCTSMYTRVAVCVCRDIVAEETGEPNSPAVTVEIAVCGVGGLACVTLHLL